MQPILYSEKILLFLCQSNHLHLQHSFPAKGADGEVKYEYLQMTTYRAMMKQTEAEGQPIHTRWLLPFWPTFLVFAFYLLGASLIAQLIKNLPAMQETWV